MEALANLKRQPIDELVNVISGIIDWYRDHYKKSSIDQILDMRSKLTAYLYTFATYVGETKEAQLLRESDRKLKHSLKRKEFLEANYTIAKAEDEAILATEEERRLSDSYESYYVTLRLMLEAANKVDDVLQQKVSVMKKEYERDGV